MPQKIILILALCIFSNLLSGQDCIQREIYLFKQSEIDRFIETYGPDTCLDGDLMIEESYEKTIFNLNGLSHLKKITGSLRIENNHSLTNLSGLEGLQSVESITIYSNENLESIGELKNLTPTSGIYIRSNPNLITLDTLAGLDSIGSLVIENNEKLQRINGLALVTNVPYRLIITHNDQLTNLQGLHNLIYARELTIENNAALTNLQALSSLDSAGIFNFSNNGRITDLSGLDNLKSLGIVSIAENEMLSDIQSLSQINPARLGKFEIRNNPSLSSCAIFPLCERLGSPNLTAIIDGNGPDCNSVLELIDACGLVLDCPTDLVIQSQRDLNLFSLLFPQCDTITGNLIIHGDGIVDLNGLSTISCILGDLELNDNTDLVSLSGLEQLKFIGGELNIRKNHQLTSLAPLSSLQYAGAVIIHDTRLLNFTGLDGLSFIPGQLFISSNDSLTSLAGLSHLTRVEGKLTLSGNYQLPDLSGLHRIEYVGGALELDDLLLESLDGLSNIDTIAGALTISECHGLLSLDGLNDLRLLKGLSIVNNNGLINLSGLSAIDSLSGRFEIRANSSLMTFGGLTLRYVGGNITIADNPVLESIQAFHLIREAGSLTIRNNLKLSSLNTFSELESVNGPVTISLLPELQSLSGLQTLKSVNGHLIISENSGLESLFGLEGLRIVSGDVAIKQNPGLLRIDNFDSLDSIGRHLEISTCGISEIHGFSELTHIGGVWSIRNNANLEQIFCNDQLQQLDGLEIMSNNKLKSIELAHQLVTLTGDLRLSSHFVLDTISMLTSLAKVTGAIQVSGNSKLGSIPFIEQVEEAGSINVSNLAFDTLRCSGLKKVETSLNISSSSRLKALLLDSLVSIGTYLRIYETGVEHLDHCNALQKIGQYVTISENDHLLDIHGFSGLTLIGDRILIENNEVLQSIQGFSSVNPDSLQLEKNYVNNSIITIQGNPNLAVCSLPPICTILEENKKGYLIGNNHAGCMNETQILASCDPAGSCIPDSIVFNTQAEINEFPSNFPGCHFIMGSLILDETEPGSILSLDSLIQIRQIGGNLVVRNTAALQQLAGLDSLSKLGESLVFHDNQSLTSLLALQRLELNREDQYLTTADIFQIHNNPSLSDCHIPFMCGALTYPNHPYWLEHNLAGCNVSSEIQVNCHYPVSCELEWGVSQADIDEFPIRFPQCTHLASELHLHGSFSGGAISDLRPLTQLVSIDGPLTIESTNLSSLEGLEHIQNINGTLFIIDNYHLQDIAALTGLNPASVKKASVYHSKIEDNPQLSSCAIAVICSLLADSEKKLTVSGNETGCSDAQEVVDQCLVATIIPSENIKILIYPNPADDIIYLKSLSNLAQIVSAMSIIDMQGHTWWSGPFAGAIHVRELPAGLYGLILHTAQHGPVSFKVVIQ